MNARDVLLAAQFDDPETLDAVAPLANEVDGAAVAAANDVLKDSHARPAARWAAAYLYAASGPATSVLRILATDESPTLRLFAADGLVRRGDAAGFPVLVDLLPLTDEVVGASPPRPVWRAAASVLVEVTGRHDLGPPADADDLVRSDAVEHWTAWLQQEGRRAEIDPATGDWNTA